MPAPLSLDPTGGASASLPAAPPAKSLTDAAKQFEALLIGQLLKSAHGDDDGGWLGTGEDTGDATAAGLAEEQFAQSLAAKGGLGLSSRIVASLTPAAPKSASSQSPTLRGILPSDIHH
jgi:Rod binding domain-containing protein